MGDRANYAIVHQRKLSIHYGHCGGPTVPRELRHGPAACETFIRSQERVRGKRLLDFAYMEGAIALDKDRQRVLFFGGPGEVNYVPEVQARLLERLKPIWEREGWTIGWARRYAYDFVEFLGLPGTTLEASFYVGPAAAWEEVIARNGFTQTVLARRTHEGWDLRSSSRAAGHLVPHGPKLLEAFTTLPVLESLDEMDARLANALLFDESRQTLVIISPLFGSLNSPHYLAENARKVFPGWTIELDLDLPSPTERLQARGIELVVNKRSESEPEEPLTSDQIDAIIDRALAYAPETSIEAQTEAAEMTVQSIVADAEGQGQTVQVIRNLPGKPKTKADKKTTTKKAATTATSKKRGKKRTAGLD